MLRETLEFGTLKRFPDSNHISFSHFPLSFFLNLFTDAQVMHTSGLGWERVVNLQRRPCCSTMLRLRSTPPGLYVMTKWLETFYRKEEGCCKMSAMHKSQITKIQRLRRVHGPEYLYEYYTKHLAQKIHNRGRASSTKTSGVVYVPEHRAL